MKVQKSNVQTKLKSSNIVEIKIPKFPNTSSEASKSLPQILDADIIILFGNRTKLKNLALPT